MWPCAKKESKPGGNTGQESDETALKFSSHISYAFIMSAVTLGFLLVRMSLKSAMVIGLGFEFTSAMRPESKSSLTTFSCTAWHMSLTSLPEKPSVMVATSFRSTSWSLSFWV